MTKRTIVKQSRPIYKASLIPATDIWPHRDECQGKQVLIGLATFGQNIRTSLVVAGSVEEGWVETLNSVYIIMPGEPHGEIQEDYKPSPDEVASALADAELMNENMRLYGTIDKPTTQELWDANPNCVHDIQPAPGGGVRCTKCSGWFCY